MANLTLDHVGVLTSDLATSVHFYQDVLGLTVGDRPPMPFDGAWLYDGNRPVLHLMCTDSVNDEHSGALDHVAFRAEGLEAYRSRLDALGLKYRTNRIDEASLTQLFVRDPQGITVELNFFGS